MAYQTRDVVDAMVAATGLTVPVMRVDGGAAVNNLAMQFQSDILQVPVQRPHVVETTALGAAYLAGLSVGYWDDLEQLQAQWCLEREYTPRLSAEQSERLYRGWQQAVRRAQGWAAASGQL
jgi:glycerol kinase